jgi:hypothetical protein
VHQSTGISSFQIALPLLQAGRVVYDEQVSYRKLDSYMTLKISNPKKWLVGWLVGWLKRVITIFGLCMDML